MLSVHQFPLKKSLLVLRANNYDVHFSISLNSIWPHVPIDNPVLHFLTPNIQPPNIAHCREELRAFCIYITVERSATLGCLASDLDQVYH